MADIEGDETDPHFREKLLRAFARLTPEELKRIDASWKSNMDKKVDRLVAFADTYEDYLKLCLEREKTAHKIRLAVLEKTIAGVLWVLLGVIVVALWNYAREHLA